MTEQDREAVGAKVEQMRKRRYGAKSAAYGAASINAATWDRIEKGLPVREDRLLAALNLLWPEVDGDWRSVISSASPLGPGQPPRPHDFQSWVEQELQRLDGRVAELEDRLRKDVRQHAAPTNPAGGSPAESASVDNVEQLPIAAHPKKGRESTGRQVRRSLDEVGEESQDTEGSE